MCNEFPAFNLTEGVSVNHQIVWMSPTALLDMIMKRKMSKILWSVHFEFSCCSSYFDTTFMSVT